MSADLPETMRADIQSLLDDKLSLLVERDKLKARAERAEAERDQSREAWARSLSLFKRIREVCTIQTKPHMSYTGARYERQIDEILSANGDILKSLEAPRARSAQAAKFWSEELGKANARNAALDSELTALRSQLARAGARGEWRTMETAPKDGSKFLAFTADFMNGNRFNERVQEARWYGNSPEDLAGYFASCTGQLVTHWMPLPAPPGSLNESSPVIEGDGVTERDPSKWYWMEFAGSVDLLEPLAAPFEEGCRYMEAVIPTFPPRSRMGDIDVLESPEVDEGPKIELDG